MINLHFGTSDYLYIEKKCLILVSRIHLVLSSLEIQRRLIQTKYVTSFVTLSEKKQLPNSQKYQLQNNFSLVCMSLLHKEIWFIW